MVLLLITPAIASALERLPAATRDELSLPTPTSASAISHSQLVALSKYLLSDHSATEKTKDPSNAAINNNETYTLNSLLRGTKLYIPPPPPKPEPSPEYLALKARLTAEAEANKYNALLRPQPIHRSSPFLTTPSQLASLPTPNNPDSDFDSDSDPLTPSLVLNILISVLFTGFASYWALSNFRIPTFFTFTSTSAPSYPGAVSSQPARVFISLFVAVIVGVAEVGVFALYLSKVEMARGRERGVVERKVVVGEVGAGEEGNDNGVRIDGDDERKKEEIWGRGVNGGARRRVRERWKGRGRGRGRI
ncbi:hypothetical protein AJ79_09051 [Helicocarpus griseus UAMH5409]|uniref:ATPase, vacuolar ER assembly factor, Vma12 n=1 Tax=Helicocarpus griseus UAMH5409 TaxID=1447875 RepID=A0A2B7WMV8_9EURO|nr:hypothetical protein AJ79_09051 [Helicocarpus griseus UAMH5409]